MIDFIKVCHQRVKNSKHYKKNTQKAIEFGKAIKTREIKGISSNTGSMMHFDS